MQDWADSVAEENEMGLRLYKGSHLSLLAVLRSERPVTKNCYLSRLVWEAFV